MDRASTAKQTAALLNAQSVHLDVLEVSVCVTSYATKLMYRS
jgi:hypothetical protein